MLACKECWDISLVKDIQGQKQPILNLKKLMGTTKSQLRPDF